MGPRRPGSRRLVARSGLVFALVVGATLTARPSLAAPIEASGSATAEAGASDGARERALAAARRTALEQAIASIDIAVDDAAVAQVLARAEAWTAGYRVLEVREQGSEIQVSIEAEIDLPRLRKRIAARSAGPRDAGFRWSALKQEGCGAGSVDEQAIRGSLQAYGIVADAGETSLSLRLRCIDRGAVTHTHVRAAAVELSAQTQGARELTLEVGAQGFAPDLDAATAIALDRALAELADALAVEARGELELRVEQPWPAARVRVLEDSLRASVIGVDAAALAGIAADGTAIIRIRGSVDSKTLGQQLQASSFPGFGLVGLRLDNAHVLRVRMQ